VVAAAYGKLPLSFEVNQGQTDPCVKFLSHGSGYSLFLTNTEAVLSLRKSSPVLKTEAGFRTVSTKPQSLLAKAPSVNSVVRIKLMGANLNSKISGLEELPGRATISLGKIRRNGIPTCRTTRK
jgi:hypothetical protein